MFGIIGAVLMLKIVFLLPETLRRSKDTSQVEAKKKHFPVLKKVSSALYSLIVMLGDPTVLVITIYNPVIFASLFFLVSA